MGPKLCLSYDTIDIGDVFASSVHTYEVNWNLNFKTMIVGVGHCLPFIATSLTVAMAQWWCLLL